MLLSVSLQLQYGPIKLLETKADLCDQFKNVDLKCPLEPGHTVVTKDVALPNHIPKVRQKKDKINKSLSITSTAPS